VASGHAGLGLAFYDMKLDVSVGRKTEGFMRIQITPQDDSVSARTRAYAEYRVFTTLARHSRRIQSVWVSLGPPDLQSETVTCEVNVTLQTSGTARAMGRGHHAHAAIDEAAESIGQVVDRLKASNE
jgi:ribosome-associated translation inhibitor RaiA